MSRVRVPSPAPPRDTAMKVGDKVVDTIDNTLWIIRDIWSDGDLTLESCKHGYEIDISIEAFEETFVLAQI